MAPETARIIPPPTRDGSKRHRVTFRLKRGMRMLHHETKTSRANALTIA